MNEEPCGEEYMVSEVPKWSSLSPLPGHVLEVMMGTTSYVSYIEGWAAFLVLSARNWVDGSLALEVYHLGAEDNKVDAELDALFNDEPYFIHLCLSEPCIAPDQPGEDMQRYLHVTQVRHWGMTSFAVNQNYISGARMNKAQKMRTQFQRGGERGSRREKKGPGGAPKRKPATKAPAAGRGRGKKPGGEADETPGDPPPEAKGGEEDESKDPRKREELRGKLRKARELLQAPGGIPGKTVEGAGSPGEIVDSSQSSGENSGSAAAEELQTGLRLNTAETVLAAAAHKKKKKEEEKAPGGGRSHRKAAKPKAIKDDTMKTLSGQLVQQALAVNQIQKEAKKKKKKREGKKDSQAHVLGKVLSQLLRGRPPGGDDPGDDGGNGGKKKKKKKKRKRKLKDGVICSSETDSSDVYTSETEEASSETDLEAPLRKKSRDHPGSVLQMLIQHIKDQMDQTALTEAGQASRILVSGIKVMSYFNLFIKTAFPHHQRELHELHHIAAALDLLRMGDVARVGDTLAARYMSIHQSMVDSSWATARHMEIHALEDSTAAGPAAILATRKHARLVAKVQGALPLGSGPAGPGRAGKGKGGWHQTEGKGEKGDTRGKGKGKKGKSKWGPNQSGPKDWDKTRDKGEEKPKT
eukprot:s2350_g5.t1